MNDFKQKIFINIGVVVAIWLVTALFFKPMVFEGKKMAQHDIKQWRGGAEEVVKFREANGDENESLWTNSMFGGMPAYLVSMKGPGNLMKKVREVAYLGMPYPASTIFAAMLSFYILAVCFGVRWYYALIGAIAYAFASFNIFSLAAGHNAKIQAIGWAPLIIAGAKLIVDRKWLIGVAVMALGTSLEIISGHLQITYYTIIVLFIFGIVYLVDLIREKQLPKLLGVVIALIVAGSLAILPETTYLWTLKEYSDYSTRGKSEITLEDKDKEEGLTRDYVFQYSQGTWENLSFIVPNVMGGASAGKLDESSESFKALRKQGASKKQAKQQCERMPTYWGDQRFTAGPVYIGAVICFLFVLGLFVVDKKYKIWLVSATLLGIIFSMGRNFPSINNLFYDFLPGYNKFRTVSMAVMIVQLTMPLLAVLALQKVNELKEKSLKPILMSGAVTGGLLLLILIGSAFASFSAGENDKNLPEWILEAILADRASLLRADVFRSLLFVAIAFGILFAWVKDMLKPMYAGVILVAVVLTDMTVVSKRYFAENYIKEKKVGDMFKKTPADNFILADKELNYRVLNVTRGPGGEFNESETSFYHKSIGGYHGAKIRRFQDIVDRYLGKRDPKVLSMMNVKYAITDPNKEPVRVPSLGNVWLVEELIPVKNPDEEIAKIGDESFDPSKMAIVDESKFKIDKQKFDVTGQVRLKTYQPNKLTYQSNLNADGFAVFSEVYYPKGWNVTIDGKPVDYLRVNYLLRGMRLPKGKHTIEFSFHPKAYYAGEKISFAASLLLILLCIGAFGKVIWDIIQKEKGKVIAVD